MGQKASEHPLELIRTQPESNPKIGWTLNTKDALYVKYCGNCYGLLYNKKKIRRHENQRKKFEWAVDTLGKMGQRPRLRVGVESDPKNSEKFISTVKSYGRI